MSTEPEAGPWFARMDAQERSRAADACLLLPECSYAYLTKKVPRWNAATEAPKRLRTRSKEAAGTADATVVADNPATCSTVIAPLLLSKGDRPARVPPTAVSVRLTRSADSSPLARRSRPSSTSPLRCKPQGDTVSPTRPSFPQRVHARREARQCEAQGILGSQRRAQSEESTEPWYTAETACPMLDHAPVSSSGTGASKRFTRNSNNLRNMMSKFEAQTLDMQKQLNVYKNTATSPADSEDRVSQSAPPPTSHTASMFPFSPSSHLGEGQTVDMQKKLNVNKSNAMSSADSEDRVLQPAPPSMSRTASTFSRSPSSNAEIFPRAGTGTGTWAQAHLQRTPSDSGAHFKRSPSDSGAHFKRSSSFSRTCSRESFMHTPSHPNFTRTPSDAGPASLPLTRAPLRTLSSSANYNNYRSVPRSRLQSLELETKPEVAPKGGGAGLDWEVNVITFCKEEGDAADNADDDDGRYEDEKGERESGSQDFFTLKQQGAHQLCEWTAAFEHPHHALLKEQKEDEVCLNTIKIDPAGSEIPESRGFSPIAACTSISGFSSTSSPTLEEDGDMTGRFAALLQMEEARKSKKYYWEEEDYISEDEQDGKDQMHNNDASSDSEEFGLKGPEILRMFGLEVPEIEEEEGTIAVKASALKVVSFRRTASNGGGGRSEKPSPPAPHSPALHAFFRRTASGCPGDIYVNTATVHDVGACRR